MELFFCAKEIGKRLKALTFNDVLLVPRHSEIDSRRRPNLKTKLTKNFSMNIPIIASNMDTITESKMACAMAKFGGVGILHRFMTIEDQVAKVKKIMEFQKENNIETPIAASIGVKEDDKKRAQLLVEAGVKILTVDIAHGDSVMMFRTMDYVKKQFPNIDLIAGNTATAEGVRGLIEHGADAVKVGIGPGSRCTTRIITGCGRPQLTAVGICAQEAKKYDIPIIADGGIKTSGDIVKALVAGASSVMLGSMLAGTLETPGEIKGGKKSYRGMASKEAQVSWRGELPKGMAAEGVATWLACKGSVENVIEELCGGIRSGMTYLNAEVLPELEQNGRFVEMTGSGWMESGSHGL